MERLKKQKKILIAASNYWNSSCQVGTHHIAKYYANKGWDVAYISDPVSALHFVNGVDSEVLARFKNSLHGGYKYKTLWTYVPFSLLTPNNKPILRSRWVNNNWQKLTIPRIISKIKKQNFDKVDILFFDSINQSFLLDEIQYKKSVLRIADNSSGFSKYTQALREKEKALSAKVDMVLYTAKELKSYVDELGAVNSSYFPNGVNFSHFYDAQKIFPSEFQNIKKPIVIYVGAIKYWFDFELVRQVAKELKHLSFVLIGQDSIAQKELSGIENIHLLGAKPFSDIPSYLYFSDIGIIPFNVGKYPKLINSVNPLKMYEYLACGLPVVATEWEELRTMNVPINLAKNKDEFIRSILDLLNKSSEEMKIQNIEYARQNDWENRIEYLEEILEINT